MRPKTSQIGAQPSAYERSPVNITTLAFIAARIATDIALTAVVPRSAARAALNGYVFAA